MAATEDESVTRLIRGRKFLIAACVETPQPVTIASPDNSTPEPSLVIDVEDADTNECWSGTFAAAYLEGITHKTGSFKRFPVLHSMLISAMRGDADSVSLDLLTFADLEAIKHRGRPPSSSAAPHDARSAAGSNKRYLILTYAAEFDRVHYPLPLGAVEAPALPYLQRRVRRLTSELVAFRRLAGLPLPQSQQQQRQQYRQDSGPSVNDGGGGHAASLGLFISDAALLTGSVSALTREVESLRLRLADAAALAVTQAESVRSLQQRLGEAEVSGDS